MHFERLHFVDSSLVCSAPLSRAFRNISINLHASADPITFPPGQNAFMSPSSTPSLHLEGYITALRVLALAGQFRCLLRFGTCIAAVILSRRSRAFASRVFAFFRRGHKSSINLNMPSLV